VELYSDFYSLISTLALSISLGVVGYRYKKFNIKIFKDFPLKV